MRKKILPLTITAILSVALFTSFGQSANELYAIVSLKGSIVKKALAFPAFSRFDFTFKQIANNTYALEGFAIEQNGQRLGNKITLTTLSTPPPRPLKNLEKGHLYLTLAIMKEKNVDGSEDYILTPKKCKDKSGTVVDYVSYRFSNKVEQTSTAFLPGAKVQAFDLNPSPPY